MSRKVGALDVQVLRQGQALGFQHAAVHQEQLVARRGQVVDDGAPDEARAAEDDDSLRPSLTPPQL
ncbi:MAG: hypothetical protein E6J37_05340 [Chloroflexi bacterium]|nr:MAG: hypothetical protein E6J37_05340 [Chloroflexota bacterium]